MIFFCFINLVACLLDTTCILFFIFLSTYVMLIVEEDLFGYNVPSHIVDHLILILIVYT